MTDNFEDEKGPRLLAISVYKGTVRLLHGASMGYVESEAHVVVDLGELDVDLVAEQCRIRLKALGHEEIEDRFKVDLKIVLGVVEDVREAMKPVPKVTKKRGKKK